MTSQDNRHVHSEIINLSGGLFGAHATTIQERGRREGWLEGLFGAKRAVAPRLQGLFATGRAEGPRLLGLFAPPEEEAASLPEASAAPRPRRTPARKARTAFRVAGVIALTLGVAGAAMAGTIPGTMRSHTGPAISAVRAPPPSRGAPARAALPREQPAVVAQSVAEPVMCDTGCASFAASAASASYATTDTPAAGGATRAAPAPPGRPSSWSTANRRAALAPPSTTIPAPPASPVPAPLATPVVISLADLAAPEVEMNRQEAAVAIAFASRRAAGCIDADDPRTTVPVRVTFAPSGRVTIATVDGGPFAGTLVGGCVASALRSASVGSFEGAPTTVRTTIRLR